MKLARVFSTIATTYTNSSTVQNATTFGASRKISLYLLTANHFLSFFFFHTFVHVLTFWLGVYKLHKLMYECFMFVFYLLSNHNFHCCCFLMFVSQAYYCYYYFFATHIYIKREFFVACCLFSLLFSITISLISIFFLSLFFCSHANIKHYYTRISTRCCMRLRIYVTMYIKLMRVWRRVCGNLLVYFKYNFFFLWNHTITYIVHAVSCICTQSTPHKLISSLQRTWRVDISNSLPLICKNRWMK